MCVLLTRGAHEPAGRGNTTCTARSPGLGRRPHQPRVHTGHLTAPGFSARTAPQDVIDNAQVVVFLAYASPAGYTQIDPEIYLPRSWSDDPARCAAAGVLATVRFATKIALRRRMLARAVAAGVPATWCTADEFYGGDACPCPTKRSFGPDVSRIK